MIRAKKSLGQNFLIDKNIINIITSIQEIENRAVLEIGPGTGNLTSSLLKKKPKKVIVIEKDYALSSILKKNFQNQITLINDDVLKINERLICKDQLIVFGNLPYNISTEILCKWILNLDNKKAWFDCLILMFQKEVADRIVANYNSSNYGRLSILANWRLNIRKIIDIKPGCFFPKPKIESSLLIFTPKNDFLEIKDPCNLEKITRIFFSQRRKMIKSPFNKLFSNNMEILDKLNITLKLRPQNLDHETYYMLAKEYEKLRN